MGDPVVVRIGWTRRRTYRNLMRAISANPNSCEFVYRDGRPRAAVLRVVRWFRRVVS